MFAESLDNSPKICYNKDNKRKFLTEVQEMKLIFSHFSAVCAVFCTLAVA